MDARTDPLPQPTSRRVFLGRSATCATVAFIWPAGWPGLDRVRLKPTLPGAPPQALTGAEWRTLGAAVDRILPTEENAPGAAAVNAIGWIDALVADREIEEDEKARIRRGAATLDAFARKQGADDFASLSPTQQDAGLETLEARWEDRLILHALIAWSLEALLGDPIHGVNPEQIGWRWLDHRPGYPRPKEGWKPKGEGPRKNGR